MWNADKIADWFLVRHSSEMQRDAANDENLTQMKLHKLMYYSQGVCLAVFSKRLFDEELLAWRHGPVVRSIFEKYQGQKELPSEVTEEQLKNYQLISNDENSRMILEAVYEQYADYSASQLRNMTHKETPWIEAWNNGKGTTAISDETVRNFFKENIVEAS
ncbi:Panacea domain-containing protein [Enterococcus hirae]|nr:SocA family protein [Enterococcus hirae]